MKDESNKVFWERIAKIYAPLMAKDKSVYEEICSKICPCLNNDMDVLELACGSGQLSFVLSKYTKSWLGTDFSQKMIEEARKCGESEKLMFDVVDATFMPFANGEFDCVVIANALHIMPNPKKAMQEIHRVLKTRGILFAPTFLWAEGKSGKVVKTLMSITGFKMYNEWNKEKFIEFVTECGFSVVEMKLVHGGFSPIGVMVACKND